MVDSYASLLVLLLANFLLLEIVDDQRWGATGSTLLAAVALVVAISDPDAGEHVKRRHVLSIAACVAIAPIVFVALTTLGFGDLSPAVGLPHGLTVLEALFGQIFLVTLVARLVTLWVRQSEPV